MRAPVLTVSAQANVSVANVKAQRAGRSQNRLTLRGQQV